MPFVYFIQNTLTKHINDRQNFDNKVDTFKNPVFANMAEFKAQQKKLD